MADKEEGEENTTRGNDWEVVSLTASAYAASPGPRQVELKDDGKNDTQNEAETSRALFMSRHFVFPPSEKDTLPLEAINSEMRNDDKISKDFDTEFGLKQEGKSYGKYEENLSLKGLELLDEFSRTHFPDEKAKKEESIYNTTSLGSLCDETLVGGSNLYEEKEPTSQPADARAGGNESPVLESAENEKNVVSNIPCEAWWRRSAASLYAHAEEANAFWSVFIAAAVMGLVILGKRWQQERWQVLQLKWQSSVGNQNGGRMSGPILGLKGVIAGGGNREGFFIRTSSSNPS